MKAPTRERGGAFTGEVSRGGSRACANHIRGSAMMPEDYPEALELGGSTPDHSRCHLPLVLQDGDLRVPCGPGPSAAECRSRWHAMLDGVALRATGSGAPRTKGLGVRVPKKLSWLGRHAVNDLSRAESGPSVQLPS